jgi:2-polyprenyl-3-methyl-5-hydroxy-6-metoxy-1,4-benzoquinol methylase
VRLMDAQPGMRVLDLGGADGSLAKRIERRVPIRVTVADLSGDHAPAVTAAGFEHAVLSDGAQLPFGAAEFDVVLCNSVIEHATLPKEACATSARVSARRWKPEARRAQVRLADEIKRVGRGWFVQTPHKHFPIDPHVLLPFVQYLSHNAACRLVALTDRVWIKSCQGVVDWELFTPGELGALFPEGAIHVERCAGLPKSLVAWKAP